MITSLILFLGISYAEQGHYDYALPLLNHCEKSITPEKHYRYYFWKSVAEFRTLNKEAQNSCEKFYNLFGQPPKRYDALIYQMQEDLKKWGSDLLADIARKMSEVGERLEHSKAGPITQEKQKRIVEDLDKLIQEADNESKSKSEAESNAAQKKKSQNGNEKKEIPDSIIMGGKGEGKIDDKKIREIAKSWGTLPPRERAKVVNEIVRDLPPKYESMIRSYFESLNQLKR
jgi:hypothetical protein